MTSSCTDQVIGDILSSWRYDISGISPEMRVDYEQHLVECQHCRSRQRMHRTIDVTLIGLATASMLAFVLALAVIHRVEPLRNWAVMNLHLRQIDVVLTLQAAAVVGLLVSALAWILVAITTPAPVYLTDIAMTQAKELQSRLPRKAA
jgi:hypothetical protein